MYDAGSLMKWKIRKTTSNTGGREPRQHWRLTWDPPVRTSMREAGSSLTEARIESWGVGTGARASKSSHTGGCLLGSEVHHPGVLCYKFTV